MARKFKTKQLTIPDSKPYENSWATAGIDISVSSMAGAMMAYDSILDELRGPGLFSVRWERSVHPYDRLAQAVKAHDFIHSLIAACGPISIPMGNIWVGVEEAWPAGIVKKMESGWLRQQAEMVGAFKGGLAAYGYKRIYDVNNQLWKNPIREETGISKPDKFDVKKWAIEAYGVDDLPDLINSKKGLTPKPDTSKAKPVQPEDVYDALGILAYMTDTREGEVGT